MFYLVSHKFGYGLMDGGALVTMAEQWTNVPPQKICRAKEDNKQRSEYYSYMNNTFFYLLLHLILILL